MKIFIKYLVFAMAFAMILSACSSDNSNNTDDQAKSSNVEDLKESMEEVQEMANEESSKGSNGKELTNENSLKSFLPAQIPGMKQISTSAQKDSSMDTNFATTEAIYEAGDSKIKITITDTGGSMPALMGLVAWVGLDLNASDNDGFERTTTFKNFRAYEKYNSKNKYAELSVLVIKRYVVQLEGTNTTMEQLKAAADLIDFQKIVNLPLQ